MKASDLRTGNLIYRLDNISEVDWATIKLCAQRNKQFNDDWKPIPLTPEWLERFGFKKESETRYAIGHMDYSYVFTHRIEGGFTDGGYWMGIRYDDFDPDPTTIQNFAYIDNGVQYVHQLQNLYFALTGEELTLKS